MVLHEEGHGPVLVLVKHGPLSETTLWELFVLRMSGSFGRLVLLECPSLVSPLRRIRSTYLSCFSFNKTGSPIAILPP
jgi:hypothetical protein